MGQTTSSPPTPCRLQQLPNELRNRIFALAVIKDGSILVSKKFSGGKCVVTPAPPPLARTCRQFYHEVMPVYYGNNTFIAYGSVRTHPKMPNKFEEMSRWLRDAEARAVMLDKQQRDGTVRHVKLVISHLPYDFACGDLRRWGTFMIHIEDGNIEVESSGILQAKCICVPRQLASQYRGQLTEFVAKLENHCTEHLLFSKLSYRESEEYCWQCGMLRTVPRAYGG